MIAPKGLSFVKIKGKIRDGIQGKVTEIRMKENRSVVPKCLSYVSLEKQSR